jgi:hypothetical protein
VSRTPCACGDRQRQGDCALRRAGADATELFDAILDATEAGLRVASFFSGAGPDAVGLSSCSRTTATLVSI